MRALLFILILFVVGSAFAQNSLRLYSADGRPFRVYVNDRLQHKNPESSVVINNVTKDTLYLKVEFENGSRQGVTVYLLDKGKKTSGKEFDYRVSRVKDKTRLSFTGMYDDVSLPEPLVPKMPEVDTSSIYKQTVLGHFCELRGAIPAYFNNVPASGACSSPMPGEYMGFAAFLVSKKPLAVDKINIVQNICRNNCLSMAQLKTLLGYIDYDVEKLETIQLARPHITDTANWKSLSEGVRSAAAKAQVSDIFTKPVSKTTTRICSAPASNAEWSSFAAELAVPDNDTRRLDVLRKTYDAHCFSTAQIKDLLSKFLHDREKLEACKLFYTRCTDREKFMDVSATFSYPLTAQELAEFLKTRGN